MSQILAFLSALFMAEEPVTSASAHGSAEIQIQEKEMRDAWGFGNCKPHRPGCGLKTFELKWLGQLIHLTHLTQSLDIFLYVKPT